jgi:hypothetical protein
VIEGVALVKNPGNVRLDFKEFTYELQYALSSDEFPRQTTEEGTAKATRVLGESKTRTEFEPVVV